MLMAVVIVHGHDIASARELHYHATASPVWLQKAMRARFSDALAPEQPCAHPSHSPLSQPVAKSDYLAAMPVRQPGRALACKIGRNDMVKAMLAAISAAAIFAAWGAHAQQAVDWDKIQIKTTDLGNKTYMLEGQGGNITVAVG